MGRTRRNAIVAKPWTTGSDSIAKDAGPWDWSAAGTAGSLTTNHISTDAAGSDSGRQRIDADERSAVTATA